VFSESRLCPRAHGKKIIETQVFVKRFPAPPASAKEKPLAEMAATVHFDPMLNQEIAIDLKVNPEAVRRARQALTEHAGCFWMRQPEARTWN
jgi:hypothetical protein